MKTPKRSDGLDGLRAAIEAAGGQAALARTLAERTGEPIRQGHIWAWLNRSRRVPAEMVLHVEAVTGVARHQLRIDLYPQTP
jgi:DNA-binding transcriptional regulator YdaS (Cro superfamily)